MLNYYVVKPLKWDNGEEYTCFAESAEDAVEKFLDENDFDPEYDGHIIVICV